MGTPGEIRAYARQPGVTIGAGEHTDVIYRNVATLQEVLMGETGLTTSLDASTPREFRCVTGPSN